MTPYEEKLSHVWTRRICIQNMDTRVSIGSLREDDSNLSYAFGETGVRVLGSINHFLRISPIYGTLSGSVFILGYIPDISFRHFRS